MKKIVMIISVVSILILLVGCNKNNTGSNTTEISPEPTNPETNEITTTPSTAPTEPTPTETVKALTISDYYPFKNNVTYNYKGEGNEYASYTVNIDYSSNDRIQLRTNNGGTELVEVLENKNGELTILQSIGECYYRENFIDSIDETAKNTEVLLKEPLVKGTAWTIPNNRKRYISNVDVEITTPVGTFKALEVTTESTDKNSEEGKTIDYYAYQVGLVKTIYQASDLEVTSTLEKIENKVPFTQTVLFYYPNVDKSEIYPVEKQISFFTNDITRIKLEEAYKVITQEKFDIVLSKNVKINSLYLDRKNIVNIDFSKELVSDMNAGGGYESQILQCITNTFGNYYGVTNVYITVSGKPYESGHFAFKKGETLKVDMNNVVNDMQ